MNCTDCEYWFFSALASEGLPGDATLHLESCAACQKQYAAAMAIDERVMRLPQPVSDSSWRQQLDLKLIALPQSVPTSIRRPQRSWSRYAVPAVAACGMFLLGWFLKPQLPAQVNNREPVPERLAARSNESTSPLILGVINTNVRLAEAPDAARQFELLTNLADALRREAVHRAGESSLQELPRLAALYELVLRHGIEAKLTSLPADQRRPIIAKVLEHVRSVQTELAALETNLLPMAVENLRPIVVAANDLDLAIQRDRFASAKPVPEMATTRQTQALLDVLVRQGIRLSMENEPLNRAELCSELAEPLATNIVLLSSDQEERSAGELGAGLNELLTIGVANNLDRAETIDSTGSQQPAIAKVRERSAQATAVLERNLAKAPAAAVPGLQRALEASSKGREKAGSNGKGKGPPSGQTGPPWLRKEGPGTPSTPGKGKGANPPGLQKKDLKPDVPASEKKTS